MTDESGNEGFKVTFLDFSKLTTNQIWPEPQEESVQACMSQKQESKTSPGILWHVHLELAKVKIFQEDKFVT